MYPGAATGPLPGTGGGPPRGEGTVQNHLFLFFLISFLTNIFYSELGTNGPVLDAHAAGPRPTTKPWPDSAAAPPTRAAASAV
jgi:hypothetical protein